VPRLPARGALDDREAVLMRPVSGDEASPHAERRIRPDAHVDSARFFVVGFSIVAMIFLLASQLVSTAGGQGPKLPPPLPVPRHQPAWHPFPGYEHPYRGACARWTRESQCLLVDNRAAA
jgi:hypothetical protein